MTKDELIALFETDPEVRFAVYIAGLVAGTEQIVGTNGKRCATEADSFRADLEARREAWQIGAGVKRADA